MLARRSLMAIEAEYQMGNKEATEQTKTTRCLEDLLKDKQGKVNTPAPDYMQIKLNIGTFCVDIGLVEKPFQHTRL